MEVEVWTRSGEVSVFHNVDKLYYANFDYPSESVLVLHSNIHDKEARYPARRISGITATVEDRVASFFTFGGVDHVVR